MLKKYCDIIGVNIPEKECKELQTENLDDCKGCESVLEDVKRITPKIILEVEEVMGNKDITGSQEHVCGGCGKKPSEVAKFNFKTNTCNACYQMAYRIKQGPRIRKRKKEGDTPQPKNVPRCSKCGIKCTEAGVFDITVGLCGKCIVAEALRLGFEPGKPLSFKEEGEQIKGVLLNTEQTITIDFSKHPERYEELMTLAANEMRTPEMQVLYLLTKGDFSGLSHKV